MKILLWPIALVGAVTVATTQPSGSPPDVLKAASFQKCFGGTSAQDDGRAKTVVLTRSRSGVDAGCDLGLPVRLDVQHSKVEISPSGPVNGGFYGTTLLFFNSNADFIREVPWVADTQSMATQTLSDVRDFAQKHGVIGAVKYLVRIRVQPQVFTNPPGFAFRRVEIGPRLQTRGQP